ncbi:hypothetical protein CGZ98_08415 [Enemella evansiae]|nr:hypothetical protein CGZ98_08415 [Enemella evansiae]
MRPYRARPTRWLSKGGTTDPAGNTWTYNYNLQGQQTSGDDPDTGRSSHSYDVAG